MIQRKQTIYLFLAAVACIVCMCLPLGTLQLQGMGVEPVLYNMALVQTEGNSPTYNFAYLPLFIALAIPAVVALVAIFLFKNRPLQARLCSFNLLLLLVWMALFAYYKYFQLTAIGELQQTWSSVLPFVAAVFNYLAYKGIKADERLVRAADRIR
jgi:glucan phosphoethanolaminetransferase (alkaline phosphatase superfamily)